MINGKHVFTLRVNPDLAWQVKEAAHQSRTSANQWLLAAVAVALKTGTKTDGIHPLGTGPAGGDGPVA